MMFSHWREESNRVDHHSVWSWAIKRENITPVVIANIRIK